MIFSVAALFFIGLDIAYVHGAMYVDPTLPYNPGELVVTDRILSPPISVVNPPPMHTRVFYPNPDNITEDTTFGVYYFITGWGGFLYPHSYADYLSRVASHGYVVLGSWPLVTGDGVEAANYTAEAHLENIEYLKENLPIRVRNMADFDSIGLGCHSAGCGPTFDMAKMDPSMYKTSVNLEPVSGVVYQGVDFSLPSIMLGAELAKNFSCSLPGFDFETFYNKWTCPKIMFEVAAIGHCGFLDEIYWQICDVTQRCRTGEGNNLPGYRALVEGVTSAMLNTYIQGSNDLLKYVTDPDLYPLPLVQHHVDYDC